MKINQDLIQENPQLASLDPNRKNQMLFFLDFTFTNRSRMRKNWYTEICGNYPALSSSFSEIKASNSVVE